MTRARRHEGRYQSVSGHHPTGATLPRLGHARRHHCSRRAGRRGPATGASRVPRAGRRGRRLGTRDSGRRLARPVRGDVALLADRCAAVANEPHAPAGWRGVRPPEMSGGRGSACGCSAGRTRLEPDRRRFQIRGGPIFG